MNIKTVLSTQPKINASAIRLCLFPYSALSARVFFSGPKPNALMRYAIMQIIPATAINAIGIFSIKLKCSNQRNIIFVSPYYGAEGMSLSERLLSLSLTLCI